MFASIFYTVFHTSLIVTSLYLTVNENIIGDVKDIHYPHVKNIYEFSYFYSMNNPTLEGYPQLSAYVQSLLNMMSLSAESFNLHPHQLMSFFYYFTIILRIRNIKEF